MLRFVAFTSLFVFSNDIRNIVSVEISDVTTKINIEHLLTNLILNLI